jgi:hypothetical protein
VFQIIFQLTANKRKEISDQSANGGFLTKSYYIFASGRTAGTAADFYIIFILRVRAAGYFRGPEKALARAERKFRSRIPRNSVSRER